jgi:hypothetical protein
MSFFTRARQHLTRTERLENRAAVPRTTSGAVAVIGTPGGTTGTVTEHHTPAGLVDVTAPSTTVPYEIIGPMPAAGTIVWVEAIAGENKTNGATPAIFDIHKILAANKNTDGQGTTIFTTQANRPTISNGNKASTTVLPDVVAFAAGDYFAIYTDQAGTNLTTATVGMRVTFP